MPLGQPPDREEVISAKTGLIAPRWLKWLTALRDLINGFATSLTTGALEATSATIGTLAVTGAATAASGTIAGALSVGSLSVGTVGTWTPALTFGNAAVGMTFAAGGQDGRYIRLGRLVMATYRLELSAKGSSTGTARLTGLPVVAGVADDVGLHAIEIATNMAGLTSPPTGYVDSGSTIARLFDWGATGTVTLDDGNFTNTTVLAGCCVYLSEP